MFYGVCYTITLAFKKIIFKKKIICLPVDNLSFFYCIIFQIVYI
jgi:hypothetical protein